jgi:hypothetical protein
MKPAHPSDDGPVLDVHVPCVRCRYDLAGTYVFGKCPECGLEVLASVAHNADPEVAHLASPETPRAASTAVIALTVAPLLVMLAQGSGPAMRTIDALAGRGTSLPSQVERPSWAVCAAVLAATAFLFARGFSEQRNPTLRASVGSARVTRLILGLCAWAAVLAAAFGVSLSGVADKQAFPMMALAAQILPMAFTLLALAPVLGRVGALSRAYREARHGKQGAELLAGTLVGAIALYVTAGAVGSTYSEDLYTVATGLSAVLLFLSVLGLAYVTANGWVIAAGLRAPRIDPRRLK